MQLALIKSGAEPIQRKQNEKKFKKKIMVFSRLLLILSTIALPYRSLPQSNTPKELSEKWIASKVNSTYFETTDVKATILRYDFSKLWISKHEQNRIGFIGDNYQRFDIRFTSVSKSKKNAARYLVRGKTRTRGNIYDFTGELEIVKAVKLKQVEVDTVLQGTAIIRYLFQENRSQKFSGVFEGMATTSWYLDSHRNIHYDDLTIVADGYSNNEFVGVRH